MTAQFLKTLVFKNKELLIVLGVLGVIIMLPVFALFSLGGSAVFANPGSVLYTGPISTTNTYAYGNCTFWTATRREEVNRPIPNNWGNANTWDDSARLASYTVDHTPRLHAIFQTDAGALGHVAFVEKVNPDGSWEISEMNAKGWDIVNPRSFKAEEAKNYKFIH